MTDHDDKVSVVIPVYNSEKFLKDSLESVFNQSYKNIEIIAINDGSTDKSLDIINQYAEKITIISQENQGLASALMHGIEKINGKWFKWFSPDDIMHPYTIETLVNEGKKYPDAYTQEERDMMRPYLGDVNRLSYHLNANSPKGKLCKAGCKYADIQADGNVVRCSPLGNKSIGNITDEGFRLLENPSPCEAETCSSNEYDNLVEA